MNIEVLDSVSRCDCGITYVIIEDAYTAQAIELAKFCNLACMHLKSGSMRYVFVAGPEKDTRNYQSECRKQGWVE